MPPTRMYVRVGIEDWRNEAIFCFDHAMVLRGLASAARAWPDHARQRAGRRCLRAAGNPDRARRHPRRMSRARATPRIASALVDASRRISRQGGGRPSASLPSSVPISPRSQPRHGELCGEPSRSRERTARSDPPVSLRVRRTPRALRQRRSTAPRCPDMLEQLDAIIADYADSGRMREAAEDFGRPRLDILAQTARVVCALQACTRVIASPAALSKGCSMRLRARCAATARCRSRSMSRTRKRTPGPRCSPSRRLPTRRTLRAPTPGSDFCLV